MDMFYVKYYERLTWFLDDNTLPEIGTYLSENIIYYEAIIQTI